MSAAAESSKGTSAESGASDTVVKAETHSVCTLTGEALSKRVFTLMKKSKKDLSEGGGDTLARLKALVNHRGGNGYWNGDRAFNVNWQGRREDYGLRYVFRYAQWKVLNYWIYECDLFGHPCHPLALDLCDNPHLRNNVLHQLVIGLRDSDRKWPLSRDCAMETVRVLFDLDSEDNRDWQHQNESENPMMLSEESSLRQSKGAFRLLYEMNTYNRTPSMEASMQKQRDLAKQMEKVKYEHIHESLIVGADIPYEIAHVIIAYAFAFQHWDDLKHIRHKHWSVLQRQSTLMILG